MEKNISAQSGEVVQKLLRGEISAIETYDQVIEKFKGKPQETSLAAIRHEHVNAKKRLKSLATKHGTTAETSSGVWGAWAKLTTGTAKLFGEAAALKALKEGEEHGLKEYQSASENEEIAAMLKDEIGTKFVSHQETHIRSLDQLIEKC